MAAILDFDTHLLLQKLLTKDRRRPTEPKESSPPKVPIGGSLGFFLGQEEEKEEGAEDPTTEDRRSAAQPLGLADVEAIFDAFLSLSRSNPAALVHIDLQDKAVREENPLNHSDRDGEPVFLVGSLDGNFLDLVRILSLAGLDLNNSSHWGLPADSVPRIVVMGNFSARGDRVSEVVLLLFLLRLIAPDRVTLLRGRQECRQLADIYGLRTDLETRGWGAAFDAVMACFDSLPFAAQVRAGLAEEGIFVVSSGLSPDLKHAENVLGLELGQGVPAEGLASDLLWCEPLEDGATEPSWALVGRSPVFRFRLSVTQQFLDASRLSCMVTGRGDERPALGYESLHENLCLLLFSSSSPWGQTQYSGSFGVMGPTAVVNQFHNAEDQIPLVVGRGESGYQLGIRHLAPLGDVVLKANLPIENEFVGVAGSSVKSSGKVG
jgi:hypothetical protein